MPAVVKGGFWPENGVSTLSTAHTTSRNKRRVRQALRQDDVTRALANTLNGVAPGATATKTISQVEANAELGGKRNISTYTRINRVTTAADVTDLASDLYAPLPHATSPLPNLDRNPLGTR